MDPNRTLFDLLKAIHDGDDDVAAIANNLSIWLSKGGFAPSVDKITLPSGEVVYGTSGGAK